MASIIKMICCHHDQFLVWLGLAIEYKSTQLNQKLRHACIIQFTLTVTDPNNLLLVGANHPKCFDCPSKIYGQVQ